MRGAISFILEASRSRASAVVTRLLTTITDYSPDPMDISCQCVQGCLLAWSWFVDCKLFWFLYYFVLFSRIMMLRYTWLRLTIVCKKQRRDEWMDESEQRGFICEDKRNSMSYSVHKYLFLSTDRNVSFNLMFPLSASRGTQIYYTIKKAVSTSKFSASTLTRPLLLEYFMAPWDVHDIWGYYNYDKHARSRPDKKSQGHLAGDHKAASLWTPRRKLQ